MKAWIKALIGISLSLMCLFTCMGYAALSGTVFVRGTAESSPPEALFISDVSGGQYIDPNTLAYSGTVVSSNLTLRENANGEYEAFFDITVFNNTDTSYYYVAKVRSTYTLPDGTVVSYSNENIDLTVDENELPFAAEIAPGQKKTFTVRAHFAENATDTSDKTLFSVIEYQFQTTKPENKDEAAVAGVLERFPEILNDPSLYDQLIDAMNNLSGNRWVTSYIGNVVRANNDDTKAIETLFGEDMRLNIDGENKPVTVMIKRENVDGNNNTGENPGAWINGGREMTLYITANPLNVSGASVPVYAVVYTKDRNSDEWYQLGTTFSGMAKVVSYFGTGGTGSFDTGTWRDADGKSIKNLV